jgi:hypothetical protein
MVESLIAYVPTTIVTGVLILGFFNFSIAKKNLQRQSEKQISNLKIQNEQQIYSRIMEARLELENTEEFTKMAADSPIFKDRFSLVDSPSEYYVVVSFLDLFEYVFHLNKTQMIDSVIWRRWKILTETILTIPKFRNIWSKTTGSHPDIAFREFIDTLTIQK